MIDKNVLSQLKRFATAFREARDRGANEADTVMFLTRLSPQPQAFDKEGVLLSDGCRTTDTPGAERHEPLHAALR